MLVEDIQDHIAILDRDGYTHTAEVMRKLLAVYVAADRVVMERETDSHDNSRALSVATFNVWKLVA